MKNINILIVFFLISVNISMKLRVKQGFDEINDLKPQELQEILDEKGSDTEALEKMLVKRSPSQISDSENKKEKEKPGKSKESKGKKKATLNLDIADIDTMIKKKEKSANPNKKGKASETSLTGMESCEDIKKFGKQRIYCEEKYLLKAVNIIYRREKKLLLIV